MLFNKSKKKYRAIKLYSLFGDQDRIDRDALVNSTLKIFETLFHEMPVEFDIHGPYGIKKGTTVKFSTFKSKLEKFGHEKFYALEGETPGKFGFRLLFNAKLARGTYTEFIVWYSKNEWTIEFKDVVKLVMDALSLSSGYEIEIEEGCDIRTENKIKRGLFGGISLKVSYEHLQWILVEEDSTIRAIYKHNVWNEKQLQRVLKHSPEIKYERIGNLFYVQKNA